MSDLPPPGPPPPPSSTPPPAPDQGPDGSAPRRRRGEDPPWPDTGARHDAGDPDEAFPTGISLLAAFALLAWSILAQVVVVAVAVTAGVDVDGLSGLASIWLVVGMQVLTLAGVLGWLRLTGRSAWRLLGPVRPRWRHVGFGIGLGAVGFLLVQVTALVVVSAFPDSQAPSQALLEIEGGVATTIAVVVATMVMAPIVEETTYRAVLFQSARSRVGLVGGLVLSSLLFAFTHLEVLNSLPAVFGLLVLGLWLAAIFHRTGSLVVPVVAHATFNGITLLLASLVPTSV